MSPGVALAVGISVALLVMWLAVWRISRVFAQLYDERFDELAEIVAQAMAQRDAIHQKFRAEITKLLVTDSQIFDVMLEDPSDLPIPTLAPKEETSNVDSTGAVSADAE